jgi:hypothetical protein
LLQNTPRPSGGQIGNHNARKHGYYSSVLTGGDRADLIEASHIIGLDDEIALLRARLKAVVKNSPHNIRLISHLASTLARLMRTNQKLGYENSADFEKNRLKVLLELGDSFGLDFKQIIAGFLGISEAKK